MKIDNLVMVIADQNGGKSNQMRTVFEEPELYSIYHGYPLQRRIKERYLIKSDIELYLRLSSWHEKKENYEQLKGDIEKHHQEKDRLYKVFVAAQVSATDELVAGEEIFQNIVRDFDVRRGFAVWLNPDRSERRSFEVSPSFASFMSTRKEISALAIDSLALHPSKAPKTNSINSKLFADMLFRA